MAEQTRSLGGGVPLLRDGAFEIEAYHVRPHDHVEEKGDSMLRVSSFVLLLGCLGLQLPAAVHGQGSGRIGIRGGAGRDTAGGAAYGGQIEYTLFDGTNSIELGLAAFGNTLVEDTSIGSHDYHEETDLLVAGVIANFLFRHSMQAAGPYLVAGLGVGSSIVDWREESPTDLTLGAPPSSRSRRIGNPLPGGGSFQEEDGVGVGMIVNLGIGQRFHEHLDVRAQVPMFLLASTDVRDPKWITTLIVTVGIGF